MKWTIGVGLYALGMAWLIWEVRHAPTIPSEWDTDIYGDVSPTPENRED